MRALTVQQPWAWAIVHGGKDVENRTWLTSYRGPLAIHAGKRVDETGMRVVPALVASERGTSPTLVGDEVRAALTVGVLGLVNLVDVHRCEPGCCESPWAEQSYTEHGGRRRGDITHLVLAEPRPLTSPVPCLGRLGLWTPTPDVDEAVRLDLAGEDWGR